MNIGIVTVWAETGAGHVSKAYEEILSSRHNVYIYARGRPNARFSPDWDGANVTWAPFHNEGTGIWKHHFISWLRKYKIENILFNEQRQWLPILWAKDAGVVCGAYIDYYTVETVPLFAVYDYLICNTKRHYSVFKWHKSCIYVPWGVRLGRIKSHVRDCHDKQIVFMASAGWTTHDSFDRRGALMAIQAFTKVRGNCIFKLYSQNKIDQMHDEWKKVISSDSRIELICGTFSPFPYENGDVYVYPSRLDGIGLTLPEAIASGMAVIATDCQPMNEFVSDGYNGQVVPVSWYQTRYDAYFWPESICSSEILTSTMQKYVDSPDLVRLHSENSVEYAQAKLNWVENSKDIPIFIEQISKPNCVNSKLRSQIYKARRISLRTLAVDVMKYIRFIYYFARSLVYK